MKRILFLLVLISFIFPGCKFINEKILKKESDTLEAYVYTLEQELATKEAEMNQTLAQIQRESQAKIDSIIAYYEKQMSGPQARAATSGTYYLICGSFKTPAYAESYAKKVNGMGYQTEIVKMGHWNLVSAESYTNLRAALDGLEIVRSNIAETSWIYVAD